MNRRTAIVLVIKSVILTEATGCTLDEAIRYLAAICITKEAEPARISIVTDIPLSKVRKLADADSTMAFY